MFCWSIRIIGQDRHEDGHQLEFKGSFTLNLRYSPRGEEKNKIEPSSSFSLRLFRRIIITSIISCLQTVPALIRNKSEFDHHPQEITPIMFFSSPFLNIAIASHHQQEKKRGAKWPHGVCVSVLWSHSLRCILANIAIYFFLYSYSPQVATRWSQCALKYSALLACRGECIQ